MNRSMNRPTAEEARRELTRVRRSRKRRRVILWTVVTLAALLRPEPDVPAPAPAPEESAPQTEASA